jgi:hypothetical protein
MSMLRVKSTAERYRHLRRKVMSRSYECYLTRELMAKLRAGSIGMHCTQHHEATFVIMSSRFQP